MNIKKYKKENSRISRVHVKHSERVILYKLFENSGWAPKSLNILGNIHEEDKQTVAIVGSRRMSNYGKRACEYIVRELVATGVTIVSGLMYGVDICAHKTAIAAGGHTIAVLGYGLDYLDDNLYSKEVVDQIINKDKGLVISEYENEQTANTWTFPKRNKIIAAISNCVVVIEAGEQSGSIITANYAMEFGKDVYAVSGGIFAENSAGCNHLIKDGAHLLDDPSQIIEKLFPSGKHPHKKLKEKERLEAKIKTAINLHKLKEKEQKLLRYIADSDTPVSVEDLMNLGLYNSSELFIAITTLEIYSLLKKDISGRFNLEI